MNTSAIRRSSKLRESIDQSKTLSQQSQKDTPRKMSEFPQKDVLRKISQNVSGVAVTKDPPAADETVVAPTDGTTAVADDAASKISEAPNEIKEGSIQADNVTNKTGKSEEVVEIVEPVYTPVTCQMWVKLNPFMGEPRRSDFKIYNEELRLIDDREILIEGLCWTVDNYQKVFHVSQGSIMIGEQVGSVIDSRNEAYPQYMLIVFSAGWRTHTIINPEVTPVRKFIDIRDLPASLYLGTLGLPGLSAYFSLNDICSPNIGDTVLVNAAAGSVGNVVGQLAKIKGCTVIAFAGSKTCCDWIRELGFDYVFNYNTVRVGPALKRVAPRGIDFYFDCVGSAFTRDVISNMKIHGTICMFGYVNSYGRQTMYAQKEDPYRLVYLRDKRIISASVYDYESRFDEAVRQMLEWIQQGKLKYHEVMLDGFDKLPEALIALKDENIYGKTIIKSTTVSSLLTIPVEY